MKKNEILSILRKQFPTLMAEHCLSVEEYLDKIRTVEDKTALEMVTCFLINKQFKKKKDGKV